MTDSEAFREFARGASFVIIVMGVTAMVLGLLGTWGEAEPPEKFKVVDTYHGCDIIRYTDRTNSWHYFLKCNDTNRN